MIVLRLFAASSLALIAWPIHLAADGLLFLAEKAAGLPAVKAEDFNHG